MNLNEANLIAHGVKPSASLSEYYQAWQYLKDNNVPLEESSQHYLLKLVEDGDVV